MHRSALPRKQKSRPFKEDSQMQQTRQQPLFSLGQLVATRARWPLSKKQGKDRWTSSLVTFTAIGATCAKKTARKTNSAWNGGSGS